MGTETGESLMSFSVEDRLAGKVQLDSKKFGNVKIMPEILTDLTLDCPKLWIYLLI